jgi:hypothetical protein
MLSAASLTVAEDSMRCMIMVLSPIKKAPPRKAA